MRYVNLINQSRPMSKHPKMSAIDRAAQFSAFAALVGLDEQMTETARLVEKEIELSEDEIEILNRKLQILAHKVNDDDDYPKIKVICFVPDQRKDGGSYITRTGVVKRIDDIFKKIFFMDGAEVSIVDVLDFDIID